MNAQEARKKALEVNINSSNSQYAKIKRRIEDAVKLGNYETFVYGFIKLDVKEKLMKKGFNVGPTNVYGDETTTKISW